MYPTTEDYRNNILADVRRLSGKAEIVYTDVFIDPSITASSPNSANPSFPEQTHDSIRDPGGKFAAFDGLWQLDEDWTLAPDTATPGMQMGWWGKDLSDEYGHFAEPYPTLVLDHFPRPIHRLLVVGDSARGEYPVEFSVRLYDEDDSLVCSYDVHNNYNLSWSHDLGDGYVTGVARQVLTIWKWSTPGCQAKILEFFTLVKEDYTETDDELFSVELVEERESGLLLGGIVSNELVLTLRNDHRHFDVDNSRSPLFGLLKPNRRIRAWIGAHTSGGEGDPEYVPLGTFWSTEWEARDRDVSVRVRAWDRIALLQKSTYNVELFIDKSIAHIATDILTDAGLSAEEFHIHEFYEYVYLPYAWFEQNTPHREALRLLADVGMATVYVDRDNIVQFEPVGIAGDEPVLEIGADHYFSLDNPLRYGDVVNRIAVEVAPRKLSDAREEVFKGEYSLGRNETLRLTATFGKPANDIVLTTNVPAVTASVVAAYATHADIELKNTSGSPRTVELVAEGKVLEELGKEQLTRVDSDSILDMGEITHNISNHLIQTTSTAATLAEALIAFAADPKRGVEIEWRGDPALELGDVIKAKGGNFMITKNELTWTGGLRARLTGRRI